MQKKKFLIFLVLISFSIRSTEYVYPVASLDQDTMLLIQQKAVDNITLWFWDKQTKQIKSGLWSRFNPASLRLLPDKSGFSFIDNGLLKIQFFHKRSPKTIPFDEPLYDITMVQWIDNHHCYASAKNNNRFSIYQLSIDGDVECIVKSQFGDCLYPQKIDDLLFYIERINNNYRIISVAYPKILQQDNDSWGKKDSFDTQVQKIMAKQTKKEKKEAGQYKKLVIDFKRQPIAFLHMISADEGFVLEYDAYVDTKDDTILFSYLHLTKKDDNWHYNQLFSFSIPTALLLTDSSTRLYESILPLLPRHLNNAIYYVDAGQHNNLNIFHYDLDSGTTKQKTFVKKDKQGGNQHFFAPCVVNDQLFFGGTFELDNFFHIGYF